MPLGFPEEYAPDDDSALLAQMLRFRQGLPVPPAPERQPRGIGGGPSIEELTAMLEGDEPSGAAIARALRGREAMGELGMAGSPAIREAAAPVLQGARQRLGEDERRRSMILKRSLWQQQGRADMPLDPALLELAPSLGFTAEELRALPPRQASNMISQRLVQRAVEADKAKRLLTPEAQAEAAAKEEAERLEREKKKIDVAKGRRDLEAPPDVKPPARMTDRTKDDLNSLAGTAESVARLRGEFKDEFAGGGLLGGATTAAAKAAGSWAPESAQSAAAFWADWDKLINLPERNAIFGASLSAGEKSSWEGARNIKPGADPKLVRRKLDELLAITRKKGRALESSAIAEGYSADAVRALTRGAFEDGGATVPAETRVRKFQRVNGRLVEVP